MEYRREIDGLRAIAVVPVILFHAGFGSFPGGFVGVDVFFVISGYLITSIIVSQQLSGTFSLAGFYERRARRIMPALFVVMFACLPFAWFWLLPWELKSFSQSLVAVALFSSNILFFLTSGYFETAAELKPLLHTWSLAVEEQYYVLFPIMLMLGWRLGTRRLAWIFVALSSLSLVLAQWSASAYPAFGFYLLPTRSWEILLGALLAINPDRTSRSSDTFSFLGLCLIAYSVFFFGSTTPFPSLYTLVPTCGAALVILFATEDTLVGKLLGSKLLVGIGLVSYSAYLWHQPLFAFSRHATLAEPSKLFMTGLIGLVGLLSVLTWKYIEVPFRDRKRLTRKRVFAGVAIGALFFGSIGLIGAANRGFPGRLETSIPTDARIDLPKIDNGWCFYSIATIPSLSYGRKGLDCFVGSPSATRRGLLFGDSFAGQYEPLWNEVGRRSNLRIDSVTTNWCYPSLSSGFTGPLASRAYRQCIFNRKFLLENINRYSFVILGGMWSDVEDQGKMPEVLGLIEELSRHRVIVVVMPSPKQFDSSPIDAFEKANLFRVPFDLQNVSQTRDVKAIAANHTLEDFCRHYPNVFFVPRRSMFTSGAGSAEVTTDGIPYSLDGRHISIYGSKMAATQFMASKAYRVLARKLDEASRKSESSGP